MDRILFPQAVDGVIAQIRWGWYTAAGIHGYRIAWDRVARVWVLDASVILADAFKMAQRPLVFIAPTRGAEWEFPIETFEFTGARGPLTARLGAPRTRPR